MINDSESKIENKTIDLVGEVIAADTEKRTGKLIVFENNHLKEDIYSFELITEQYNRKLFKDIFLSEVKVTCLKESVLNIKERNNEKLKVKDIELL